MAEPAEILAAARLALAQGGPLAGRRVLVTAGGTQEPLDPVRLHDQRLVGQDGGGAGRGARATWARPSRLIHAPLAVPVPSGVASVPVRTAQQMCDAVLARLADTDILIGAAAVADFRPAEAAGQKIKKTPGQEDARTPAGAHSGYPGGGGRAAGGDRPSGSGRRVRGRDAGSVGERRSQAGNKRLDIIVANDVTEPGSGFGADDNRVTLLYADGRQEALPIMPKGEVAQAVLAAALPLL